MLAFVFLLLFITSNEYKCITNFDTLKSKYHLLISSERNWKIKKLVDKSICVSKQRWLEVSSNLVNMNPRGWGGGGGANLRVWLNSLPPKINLTRRRKVLLIIWTYSCGPYNGHLQGVPHSLQYIWALKSICSKLYVRKLNCVCKRKLFRTEQRTKTHQQKQ